MYLSIYLPISLSVYLANQPIICLCIFLASDLDIYLSICLSNYLSTHLSIHLSLDLFVYRSVYRSTHLSIYLYMHACMHACIPVYIHTRTHMFTCGHTWLGLICAFQSFQSSALYYIVAMSVGLICHRGRRLRKCSQVIPRSEPSCEIPGVLYRKPQEGCWAGLEQGAAVQVREISLGAFRALGCRVSG